PAQGSNACYQFVPYKYGPFSFTLFQEVAALVRNGYITSPNEHTWQLTDEGDGFKLDLPTGLHGYGREIVRYYGQLRTEQLLDIIYSRHPWFALKAEDKER